MSVEEAQERILAQIHTLDPIDGLLIEARGQVLAEDVYASFDVPPWNDSGMDGYAVRSEDIEHATPDAPVTLRMIGHVAAGYMPDNRVEPGTTIRIMTGAPLPQGADTVVPFEETDELDQRQRGRSARYLAEISIRVALPSGRNVRPAGEDVKRGDLIFPQGTLLRAAHLGVLASLGKATAKVYRRPVVAILATGDELREPGEPLKPGQIYNSNTYALAAQVLDCGAIPRTLPIARDTVEDLSSKVQSGLDADLFVTSAGVSTGEYDLVKDVLTRQGSMDFWRVRMRPGKPLAFGLLRREDGSSLPHLGLPGNPVSSMISFDQFARPAIYKMMGRPLRAPLKLTAMLQETVVNGDGRRCFMRGLVTKENGRYHVRLAGSQGSNILTAMALANGLIVVPEDRARIDPGEEVQVQVLDGHEDLLT